MPLIHSVAGAAKAGGEPEDAQLMPDNDRPQRGHSAVQSYFEVGRSMTWCLMKLRSPGYMHCLLFAAFMADAVKCKHPAC